MDRRSSWPEPPRCRSGSRPERLTLLASCGLRSVRVRRACRGTPEARAESARRLTGRPPLPW
eukprot:12892912-Alexandrium_andersonii.AAC.1